VHGKCDDVGSDVGSAALRVPEPATEKAIKKDRERKREGDRERDLNLRWFFFFFAVPIENWNWFHWKLWYAIFGLTEWSMEAKKYNNK